MLDNTNLPSSRGVGIAKTRRLKGNHGFRPVQVPVSALQYQPHDEGCNPCGLGAEFKGLCRLANYNDPHDIRIRAHISQRSVMPFCHFW